MKQRIRIHKELDAYQLAFAAAMRIFELSKSFPKEEKYSLTDQIRRASRSVWSNLAEAFRKRRYEAAFISKLSDMEGEAAETQVCWNLPWRVDTLMKRLAASLTQLTITNWEKL